MMSFSNPTAARFEAFGIRALLRRRMAALACAATLFAAGAVPARAGLDAGVAAFGRGDYATALDQLRDGASFDKNAEAQFRLAEMFRRGLGTETNPAEARKWYERAAEQNHAGANYALGKAYFAGEFGPRDPAAAASYLRRAADRGHADAKYILATMYETGNGVAPDIQQAAKLMRPAAEAGNSAAQFAFARMLHDGAGVPQDFAESQRWLILSAEHNYAPAQTALARLYTTGTPGPDGINVDYATAYLWANLAAAQGDKDAAGLRDRLAPALKPEQLAEAQRRTRDWRPKGQ